MAWVVWGVFEHKKVFVIGCLSYLLMTRVSYI